MSTKKVTFSSNVVVHKSSNALAILDLNAMYAIIQDMLNCDLATQLLEFVNNKRGQDNLTFYELNEVLHAAISDHHMTRITSKFDVAKQNNIKSVLIGHMLTYSGKPFKHIISQYVERDDPYVDAGVMCMMTIINPVLRLSCKTVSCDVTPMSNASKTQCANIKRLIQSSYVGSNDLQESFYVFFKKNYETTFACKLPEVDFVTNSKHHIRRK
jgi:hypothetical protein